MKNMFKKIPSTRFIRYDQPNDEPQEHYDGKMRIHHLMGRIGYIFLANTEKQEFALPVIHTQLDGDKNYQIDALMYNSKIERIVAVEVNGKYHFKNRRSIAKMKQKHEEIVEFLRTRKAILVGKLRYEYRLYRAHGFMTEELIGKDALSDDEVLSILT